MNFSKCFKIFGVVSFLVFGLFFTVSSVSADTCHCVGEDEDGSPWERDIEGETECEDGNCVDVCESFVTAEPAEVSLSDDEITCDVAEDEGEVTAVPSTAGSAVGTCRCTASDGDLGAGTTLEVTGYTMSELEGECREGCDSRGLHGARRVDFDHCSNSLAQRSESGDTLCVLESTATPPGETKTETETRAAPVRDCQVVNRDCMARFPSQRHIFFSNAECYCCGECTLDDFTKVFLGAADYLFGILGALALLFFIYGGVTWLTAGGSAERVDKGRKILIGAVVGIAIAVGAWFLIDLLQQAIGVKSDFRL